jgi:alanine racemase
VNHSMRRALIDQAALSANVEALRNAAPARHTLVVVKANGYGHGAVTAAHAALAGGADWLGVADVTEALELRTAGISAPILAWLHSAREDFVAAVDAGVTIGVSTTDQLDALAQCDLPSVHLKVDSGLGRNGIGRAERSGFFEKAAQLHHAGTIRIDGVMSHLAGTSRASDLSQAEEFENALSMLAELGVTPEIRHLAASAGALEHPSLRYDMVRFGISAYGLAASENPSAVELTPVMTLESEVIQLKQLRQGDGVSYNHTWVASEDTTVALVPLGYADGIPRAASGRAEVALNGQRCPVVGRIAMDQIVVDLGGHPASMGDTVTVWGNPALGAPHADDWADWAGTIGYEIVTRVGHRVSRIAV